MDIDSIIRGLSVAMLPLIFAITLHEAAHGYVASKFGDTTALMLGRVSLNPIRHIDPFGTVILPIVMLVASSSLGAGGFIFGWAKPVPVNWQNLNSPRRDMALVALAGPLANLFMAFLWAGIAKIAVLSHQTSTPAINDAINFFFMAATFGIKINVFLMLLNLIPIPPLDGSRVISSLLPPRMAISYERIEPYGIWILLALLLFGILGKILLPLAVSTIQIIFSIFQL